jgi:hypothetical protein
MTKSYDIDNPFEELNMTAAWWQLRPTDKGDGHGYTGIALLVKRFNGPHTEQQEFQGAFLPDVVAEGARWAAETTKLPQQTSKTKRVIPRQ